MSFFYTMVIAGVPAIIVDVAIMMGIRYLRNAGMAAG